ncbi:MAG: DUF5615 family PIN-like protein [Acidobacteria bacterium]|nr:DUF5615 family PIN-like protein [Acidobacteriota bacterium]
MTVRFLTDEDVDIDVVAGLRLREATIDIPDVKSSGLRRRSDPYLLELAALEQRVVITCDRGTMKKHYVDRLKRGKPTSGLIILPQQEAALGQIIESLLMVWSASTGEEWSGQIVYLPFR